MNEVDYDLIEQYVAGTLEKDDLVIFETRLKNNSQLAAELALRQEMEHFLSIKNEKGALKNKLPKLSKSFFQEQKKETKVVPLMPFHKRKTFIWGSIAATILLFLMIQFLRPTSSLYEQYKVEYPLTLAEKGGEELNLSKLEKEFAAGNYSYAKKQLKLYLAKNSADTHAKIAYAIALMELEETPKAQVILLAIYDDSTKIIFKNTVTWYLASSYLKQENFTKAKGFLEQIQEGKYSEKAQELLVKLE